MCIKMKDLHIIESTFIEIYTRYLAIEVFNVRRNDSI
jgi:hypothetical protein